MCYTSVLASVVLGHALHWYIGLLVNILVCQRITMYYSGVLVCQ